MSRLEFLPGEPPLLSYNKVMTYGFDGYNYLMRLERGERVVASILQLVAQLKIDGAWVSGVGGVSQAEIGFYNLDIRKYQRQTFDKTLEITALQGSVAWDGTEPVAHLHVTLSDDTMQAVGGHLLEATVGGTCELFLHVWNRGKLTREFDEATGLKLLQIPK
jgi:predicted DNA-binding protein with PD1-like motif